MLPARWLFILLLLCAVFSQATTQDTGCLAANISQLNSISPDDTDFSDLQFLKEILKKVDIVTLGENSHGNGSAMEAKTRIVKFLHEEMGFDVLAFESGFYDCNKTWQLIEQGHNADTAMRNGVFGVWGACAQVQPLFRYLEEQKNGDHPLVLTGFDFQFSGSVSEKFLISDLAEFLIALNIDLPSTEGWEAFAKDIENRATYRSEEGYIALDYLNKIEKELNKLEPSRENSFWLQWVKSTRWLITDRPHRDKYMAENFIWLKENYYPGRKIICWGATGHFLYNSAQMRQRDYLKDPPMGNYLKQRYQDKLYTIGGAIFEGVSGVWKWNIPFKAAKKNSLEFFLNQQCSTNNCFIDFTKMEETCFVKSKAIPVRLRGWDKYFKVKIATMMDALIFYKKMERNIPIKK